MKSLTRVFTFLTFIGIIGFQFITILDDPRHLVEPDPDCPICVAAKTEFYTPIFISIHFSPGIILFLTEEKPIDRVIDNFPSIFSIRAPPLSCFFT